MEEEERGGGVWDNFNMVNEGTFLLLSRHCSPGNISLKAAWEKCLESQTDSKGGKQEKSLIILKLRVCSSEPHMKYVEHREVWEKHLLFAKLIV